jgi:membrane-associated protease RseP (regulator of RpoE activity)
VDRAYLGVRLEPAAEPLTPHQGPESAAPPAQGANPIEGALLQEVLAGTPAAAAGLQPGDAVIGLDGQPIRSAHDLTDWLDRLPAQSTVRLDVLRGRGPRPERLSLALQTSSRPDLVPPGASSPSGNSPEQSRLSGSGSEPRPARPSLTVVPTAAGVWPPDARVEPRAEPRATPSTPEHAQASGSNASGAGAQTPARLEPPAPAPTSTAAAAAPDLKSAQVEPPRGPEASVRASVPQPERSPVPVGAPQLQDLKPTIPQAVADRLDQLERRLEKLERHAPFRPEAPAASPIRTP